MIINKNQLITIILLFTLQIAVWFQLNGQLKWEFMRNNMFLVCLMGVPISWFYIEATKYGFIAFDGTLWPGRLLGFATGIFSFAFCTNIFMGEGLTTKTAVSLFLATSLACIQIFWK